ncbi:MAG: ATP-binding protein [Proteobacteria bacterium SG_bin4]|nr:MAG: ATP-binding protein [Proteobacteria bacterium SG_bin4]
MPNLSIQKLSLRDYRCFEAIDIDFHPQLTVLVASNGAGKTAILDAIAVAFGPFVGAFDESVGKHFGPSDIRLIRVRETTANEMEYAPSGIRLEATGSIPGSMDLELLDCPQIWKRSLTGPTKTKTTIKDAKELIDYGKRLQKAVRTPDTDTLLPLLAYYGTARLWQQKKQTGKKLSRTSRTIGYTDCLDPGSSYKSFVAWFRYWSANAFKGQLEASKAGHAYQSTEFDHYLESVGGAVNACLSLSGWKDINYSYSREELVAHHEQYGELPVALLSDGIRNMIGMVADIAFRATKLNPQLGARAALETPGIVLIDEVDMHLHPEWQQVVLQSLITAFPSLQFIVTTHSPQVLTSIDASCIRLLRQEVDPETKSKISVVKIQTQTKGVSSADLLAQIMGVDPIPDVPEARMLSEFHALIQQNLHESEQGNALRTRLEAHFGINHPAMRECDRMIRLQAFKQKLPLPNGA